MALLLACGRSPPRLHGAISLRVLHSSDVHSHLFEEPLLVGPEDAARGLGALGEEARVGGAARLAAALAGARQAQSRSLYLDSGDLLEGAASFPLFRAEPELRVASALGLAAGALGNHDLSLPAAELAAAHRAFAGFPWLAANYRVAAESPLAGELAPWIVLDASGLAVAVIGVGFPLDAEGRADGTAAPGIEALGVADAVQSAIDELAPSVDLIVALTHQGLEADRALIAATSGLDLVLGGHQHVVSNGVLEQADCGPRLARTRGCKPRPVRLLHSGAFARYLGVLDLELDDRPERVAHANPAGFEITSARAALVPLSASLEPDPAATELLEPYRAQLEQLGYSEPIAFALGSVARAAPEGGDSALGNLVAGAVLRRTGADLALIASSGLRAELPAGNWVRADLARALPFADQLIGTWLTGSELATLLAAYAGRSNACEPGVQIAGFELTLRCSSAQRSLELRRGGRPLAPDGVYALATTEFVARGGSGFASLLPDRAFSELDETPETALLELLSGFAPCARSALPCVDPAKLVDGRLRVEGN